MNTIKPGRNLLTFVASVVIAGAVLVPIAAVVIVNGKGWINWDEIAVWCGRWSWCEEEKR